MKKICRYLFHVVAHIYSAHFKEIVAMDLHGHLNTLFIHFLLFVREFNLLDPKETAILDDLSEILSSEDSREAAGATGGEQNHVKER